MEFRQYLVAHGELKNVGIENAKSKWSDRAIDLGRYSGKIVYWKKGILQYDLVAFKTILG